MKAEEFIQQITEAVAKVVAEPAPAEQQADPLDEIREVLSAISKSIGELPEGQAVAGMFTAMTKSLEEHNEIFEGVLKRLEALEKGTAIKKSLAGQDADEKNDGKETVTKSKDASWDGVLRSARKAAVTLR